MQTYTLTGRRPMPRTAGNAMNGTRLALLDTGVRPAGFNFGVNHISTGRSLDRVIVTLPMGHFGEGQTWFEKLRTALPWSCRVTLVSDIGRIEIEPRGK
jgi:hypothetical protein